MKNLIFVILFFLTAITSKSQPYKDPKVPIQDRVNDLLSRMTPEEKFWQLFMIPGDVSDNLEKYKTGIFGFEISTSGQNGNASGQMLSYAPGASADETAEGVNRMQHFFIEKSRLGIPIIPYDEALHGLVRQGATAFPQSIGLATSISSDLFLN